MSHQSALKFPAKPVLVILFWQYYTGVKMNGIVVFVDLISTIGVTINTWEGAYNGSPFIFILMSI